MKFSELNLKNPIKSVEINFNGVNITVYQNLSTIEKGTLIEDVLALSYEEDGWYNPIKLDCFFNMEVLLHYTDIEMDEEDLSEAFDAAKETGLLGKILAAIPEEEYNYLLSQMEEMKKIRERNEESFVTKIGKLVTELPEKMSAAVDMINNFDKTKYAEAMNFAKALNGGRDSLIIKPLLSLYGSRGFIFVYKDKEEKGYGKWRKNRLYRRVQSRFKWIKLCTKWIKRNSEFNRTRLYDSLLDN